MYALRDSLLALPFDTGSMTALGGPIPLVEEVAQTSGALTAAHFSVSADGALVYVPASSLDFTPTRQLVWVDRTGREVPIPAPRRQYQAPSLSPDGARLAYQDGQVDSEIWIYEFRRGIFERLTSDPGRNGDAAWSPDGRRVAYHLEPIEGSPGIFVRAADGTGDIERLTTGTHLPQSWSPDGTRLVYVDFGTDPINGTGPADLGMVTVTGERRAQKLLSTPAREATPRMAPDGRWLAYETNETGETAIFVRPFPDVTAGRWRISSAGGSKPVWAKEGRTIFYRSGQTIMAVAVRGTTPADWGSPEKLFEGAYIFEDGPPTFDVAPDGRFLMIKEGGDEATTQAPDTLIVVQNWFEELRRRVPN